MSGVLSAISLLTALLGAAFFLAGSVGMLRFPDLYCRLHASTKADNLGFGLTTLALLLDSPSALAAAKLALIWGLVLLSSATSCHLIARASWRAGERPWKRP